MEKSELLLIRQSWVSWGIPHKVIEKTNNSFFDSLSSNVNKFVASEYKYFLSSLLR
jgi:hypothetical protein